jgi:hypothetical protein
VTNNIKVNQLIINNDLYIYGNIISDVQINNNVITVLSDKNIIDYIDGTILNYKAQYTIILKYRSKIAK